MVPSEKDTIALNGNLGESGEYYCEASAFNALAISEPVTIEFYGKHIFDILLFNVNALMAIVINWTGSTLCPIGWVKKCFAEPR